METLISHRSWRKCTPCLWSSAGRSRHSARHSTSLYSTWLNEWRAWDVQIKAGLAKSNLKNRVSGKLHGGEGGRSKRSIRVRYWEASKTVDHRAVGGFISGIYICLCLCRLLLQERSVPVQGPYRPLDQAKWLLRQRYHGVT